MDIGMMGFELNRGFGNPIVLGCEPVSPTAAGLYS